MKKLNPIPVDGTSATLRFFKNLVLITFKTRDIFHCFILLYDTHVQFSEADSWKVSTMPLLSHSINICKCHRSMSNNGTLKEIEHI